MKPSFRKRPSGNRLNGERYFVITLLFILIGAAAAKADDAEQQFRSDYQDKVLTFRHFYKGDRLIFQSDGTLVGPGEIGPWTTSGQISVKSIKLRGRDLEIRARRVFLVFDSKDGQPRDLLSLLAESKAMDRKALRRSLSAPNVEIDINFPTENPGPNDVSTAMDAVFVSPYESIRDFVPDYWRDYLDRPPGPPLDEIQSPDGVYRVKPGDVCVPHATYRPSPEFSEEARRAKYQGTLTLSVVVDPSGDVRDLKVVKPLGMGLDDMAAASVSTWKFKPGFKDGEPVPVQIEVEVGYSLY